MVNQIISAARYNQLQGKIAALLGTGAGDKGYNNVVSSSSVPIGETVQASHMNALYTDFQKVYFHQNAPDLATTITQVTTTEEITEALHAAYELLITDLETNRFVADPDAMLQTNAGINSTRTNNWGGTALPQSIYHRFSAGFTSPNARRGFFNAGGLIQFNATFARDVSNTDPVIVLKNQNWETILTNMQRIDFGRTETTNTNPGSGTGSAIGNEDLTTSYQVVFTKQGTADYTENEYIIRAKAPNDSTIDFEIEFSDADVGTGGGDEYVDGELVSEVLHYRPYDADGLYVNNPAPNFQKTQDL